MKNIRLQKENNEKSSRQILRQSAKAIGAFVLLISVLMFAKGTVPQTTENIDKTLNDINARFKNTQVSIVNWPDDLQPKLGKLKESAFMAFPKKETKGKLPLLISLHGAGGKTWTIEEQLARSAIVKGLSLAELSGKELILIEPNSYDNWDPKTLNIMLDYVLKQYPQIDSTRVYVMGHSMGGRGTWDWIQYSPGRFAAAAPCGFSGVSEDDEIQKLSNLPVWGMVGVNDVKNVESIKKMVNLLKASGNPNVRYTAFPEADHAAGNANVFAAVDWINWMLTFSIDTLSMSSVIMECNYASSANRRNPMHYHWNISNRISPINGFNSVGKVVQINMVRPLGGKSRNDEKIIDEDTYKWDGEKYYYDWAPLKKQIDNVGPATLYQLVTDNPPWAFQRGMELAGDSAVETYGNPWPPNDPKAWSDYIQAMLQELINTYGREQVEQWRYCIGREIGTPGHWRAGQLAFFEHYKNTVNAIQTVLPDAKVGTHFLWCSSKHPYGLDFVKWCKNNNVHYDFIGVSFYPFYNQIKRVDMDYVYNIDFAPIKDIPEWNPAATLELHEFALITSMNAKGNGFENAPKAHQESFTVMLAKMMYEHDMVDVYRWGSDKNKVAEQAFLAMKGNIYYTSLKQGIPNSPGNMVDAVFAKNPLTNQCNIMVYNYNANPDSKKSEPVTILTTLPIPPGTEIKYRSAIYKEDSLDWSAWKASKTTAVENASESVAKFQDEIPVFSFVQYEIIAE